MIRLAKRTLGVHTYTLAILVNTNDQLLLSIFEDAPKGRVCACVLRDECACIVSVSVALCNLQKKNNVSQSMGIEESRCVYIFLIVFTTCIDTHARTYVHGGRAKDTAET